VSFAALLGAGRATPPRAPVRQPADDRAAFRAGARALVCAVLVSACSGSEPTADGEGAEGSGGPRPPAVEVVTVAPESFRPRVALLGELRAVESVVLKSEIAGVIEKIEFAEGQAVEEGAVLFQLRDDEQQARVHEAEAQRALAADEFGRTRRLASQNVAAEIQLARDRAELAVAQAVAERYQAELERTRIRAPFDGAIGARLVSPGARVTPDDPLVRIDSVDPMELAFTIPESALPLATIGSAFELAVAAYPGRQFPGVVSFVAPTVDSATRRVLIKGRVPNPERLLLPGMFATVSAELGQRTGFLVPEDAVVSDPGGFFVWRIGAEDQAERVAVSVGVREGGRVEIEAEIESGDRIVTAGTHKVRAGEKVTPVAAATAAPAAPAAPRTPDAAPGTLGARGGA
jgi:membrane fusion protein, multidrug efflux system